MKKLLNNKLVVLMILVGIIGTIIVLPSLGSDSEHEELDLARIEAKILNDNIAIKRAELTLDTELKELDEAKDNKNKSVANAIETGKNRRYYVKQGEMNVYLAEKNLADTKEAEVLSGIDMYYEYLLLTKEMGIQDNKLKRLDEELKGIDKKIELGMLTVNKRTSKEIEISKANFDLVKSKDKRESLFLDMNLALRQNLKTVLVIKDVDIPFDKYIMDDIESDIEYVLVTNKDLWKLEKQNQLDIIELDIYEDENNNDIYDSNISQLKSAIKQNALDIAAKKLSLEYDVRSRYNSILNKYDAIIIKELELENLNLTLDILTKRFDLGLEIQNTLDISKENIEIGALEVLSGKLDYLIEVESYKNFLR